MTTTTPDLTTATAAELAALIDAGTTAAANLDDAAETARTTAEKKVAADLEAAEAARAELERRQSAEAQRVQARRRAHAYQLIHGGGWDQLKDQARDDADTARRALDDALEDDPVTIALAQAEAVRQRAGAMVDAYTEAARVLGEHVPAHVENYRAPSGPDLETARARVAARLTAGEVTEWAELHRGHAEALIHGDDPALSVHVPTAAERAAANEASRLAKLEDFKARESVESRTTFTENAAEPYLHRAVVTYHDMQTGEALPESAPNDETPGVLGIIAARNRFIPLAEVTAEDVAEAVKAGTITATAAQLHGLPDPAPRRG